MTDAKDVGVQLPVRQYWRGPRPPRNLRFRLDTSASMLYCTDMTNTTGSITIDTPEGIAFFQLLSAEGILKMKVNHGMNSRADGRKWCNHRFGTDFKASAKGNREALAFIQERILDAKVDKEIRAIEASGLYEITDEDEARKQIREAIMAEDAQREAGR